MKQNKINKKALYKTIKDLKNDNTQGEEEIQKLKWYKDQYNVLNNYWGNKVMVQANKYSDNSIQDKNKFINILYNKLKSK